jgi:hypothetical protein
MHDPALLDGLLYRILGLQHAGSFYRAHKKSCDHPTPKNLGNKATSLDAVYIYGG